MKSKNSPSYHHGNLKEALLVEVLNIIEEEGLSSLTLRGLTQRLGTSRSAIYRHYNSKEELLVEALKSALIKLDTHIYANIDMYTKLEDKIYHLGKSYIHFALENPNVYRAVFGHETQEERKENCNIHEKEDAVGFHKLVDIMALAQEQGIIKSGDPFMQATVHWSMLHGIVNLLIDGHVHIVENIDVLYDESFQTFFYGMQKRD